MTEQETGRRWIVPMQPRSPDEPHRSATPLELFFDLVFVVAVSQAAAGLHHGIAENHFPDAIVSYLLTFFGIWWAWMNFTWFASSYDTDDVPYRLLVFVQMIGALILASGVPRIFDNRDLSVVVLGYVVMRVAAILQWTRAARADPKHRPAAIRYAVGIGLLQVCWVILVFLPASAHVPGFIVLAIGELLVPVWAERSVQTPWHPRHIAERFGLFTIIVLGESVLSSIVAIQSVLETASFNNSLLAIILGGLLTLYGMWWLYFYQPVHGLMTSLRFDFIWAYGHLLIFGSAAAVGAGLALTVDQFAHHGEGSAMNAGITIALPTAIYLLSVWILQERPGSASRIENVLFPLFAFLILLTPLTGQATLATGILIAVLLIIKMVKDRVKTEDVQEA